MNSNVPFFILLVHGPPLENCHFLPPYRLRSQKHHHRLQISENMYTAENTQQSKLIHIWSLFLQQKKKRLFSSQSDFFSLVFGDEFLAQGLHLKSHQRCSAGIRPVKFFHTDWIIISLWFLSSTQRHCHVRIEKGSVQTVAIKLEAHNSLEYHYMLKH